MKNSYNNPNKEKHTGREKPLIFFLTIVTVSVSLNIGISLYIIPKISLEFGNTIAEWGLIIQSIFIISLYLFFGKVGDIIGLSAMCRYGSCLLAAGYYSFFLCNDSTGYLIASLLTGIGTAMFSSVSSGQIRNYITPSHIPFGFSLLFIGFGAGFIFGPFLVEMIEILFSWHIYYLILTPLPLLLVILYPRFIDCRPNRISLKMIDVPCAILLMFTLFFIYSALIQILKQHLTPSEILFLILGFFSFIVLVFYEKKAKMPFLDLNLIKRPDIITLILVLMIMVLMYRSYLFYFQLYFEEIVNVSSHMSSVFLLIQGISFLPLAIIIGYFGRNWEKERFIKVCILGCVIGILGVLIHGLFYIQYPMVALVIFGAYNVCIRISSYTLYFLSVSPEESGIAGGMIETGVAFVNPIVITVTGFFFHLGFQVYSPGPICWQKIGEGFSYGNLGLSIFYIFCIIIQIILLIWLKKSSHRLLHKEYSAFQQKL